MRYFHVSGTLEWKDLQYCECPYCQGHGTGETRQAAIDTVAKACDEQDAAERVKFVVAGHAEEVTWMEGPHVEEMPELVGTSAWPIDRVY